MCSNVPGHVAPAICEPCRIKGASTVATVYCATCDEFQCKECTEAHEIYTVMKNHELMKASESKRHLVGLKLCDEHKNNIRFFCEDDNKLCCGICAFTEHRSCKKVAEIGTYAQSLSHDTDSLIDAMSNFQSTVTSYRNVLDKKTKGLHYQVEQIPERIDALQENINEKFDDMLQNVVKEANGVMEQKVMTITERQRKCKMIYSEIEDLLINIDQILEWGTYNQTFIAQHKLVEIYEGYLEKVKYLASNIDSLNFELDFELDPSEKDIGHIYTFITKELMTNEEELQGTVLTNIASRDLKKSEDDVSAPLCIGMDFLLDGRLIAADNKNKKLVIFNQKLELIGEYKLPDKPCCLSASKENEVAVTYSGGFYIEIYVVSSLNKIIPLRSIKTTSSFNRICQKDDTSFIAGCQGDQKFVKCLSLQGEENNLDIEFPSKPLTVDCFSCTYIKNLNKLIITEQDEDNVYIFNLKTKERRVVNDSRIKTPVNAAVGPFDIILILCENGDLVQISPSGRVLAIKSTGVMTKLSCSISVSKDETTVAISSIIPDNNIIGAARFQLYKVKY